jgi:hypothetical protein
MPRANPPGDIHDLRLRASFILRIQLSESRDAGHCLCVGILPAVCATRGYLRLRSRICPLSLGKRSTFPDWVLASRTPSHYDPRIQRFSLLSPALPSLFPSRIKALARCVLAKERVQGPAEVADTSDEISIPSFDSTLRLYQCTGQRGDNE